MRRLPAALVIALLPLTAGAATVSPPLPLDIAIRSYLRSTGRSQLASYRSTGDIGVEWPDGSEIRTVEGTRTVVVARIDGLEIERLEEIDGRNVVLGVRAVNGARSAELWRVDGSTVRKVWSVGLGANGAVGEIVRAADGLLFTTRGADGVALWESDGTKGGTRRVTPTDGGNVSAIWGVNRDDDGSIFCFVRRGRDVTLERIDAGVDTLLLSRWAPMKMRGQGGGLTKVGDRWYFWLSTNHVPQIWSTDGTRVSTRLVATLPGFEPPRSPVAFRDELYFLAPAPREGRRLALWQSDGADSGTKVVGDSSFPEIDPSSAGMMALDDAIVFIGRDTKGQSRLYVTDGVQAHSLLGERSSARQVTANPRELRAERGLGFFVATGEAGSPELWKTDGTALGTSPIGPLATGGTITGTVTDASTGLPIAGLTVAVYSADGFTGPAVTTATDGTYTLSGMNYYSTPRQYYVRAKSFNGYASQIWDGVKCPVCNADNATLISVAVDTTVTGIDFALEKGWTISGKVTTAEPIPPTMYPGEIWITDAWGNWGDYFHWSSDGTYQTDAYPPGTYYALLYTNAGNPNAGQRYDSLSCGLYCADEGPGTPIVISNANVSGIDFSLQSAPHLIASVTDSLFGFSLVHDVSLALSSGEMYFTQSGGGQDDLRVPSASYYVMTGDGPAWSSPDGYADKVWDNVPAASISCSTRTTCDFSPATLVNLVAGGTVHLDFSLDYTRTRISGTITNSMTGSAVSNLWVTCYPPGGTSPAWFAKSDSNGLYVAQDSPTDCYLETDTSPASTFVPTIYGYGPCTASCPPSVGTIVHADEGTTLLGIDMGVDPAGRLEGTVVDSVTLAPIPFATVYAKHEDDRLSADFDLYLGTDASGHFASNRTARGTYRLQIYNTSGYENQIFDQQPTTDIDKGTPVLVGAGQTADVTVKLRRLAQLTVHIVNNYGPAGNVNIAVTPVDLTQAVIKGTTDDSGIFHVATQNFGDYLVAVDDPWFVPVSPAPMTAHLTPGANEEMTFEVTPPSAFHGYVVDADTESPLASVPVAVLDAETMATVATAQTGTDGVFATQLKIPQGTYRVMVGGNGWEKRFVGSIACPFGTSCDAAVLGETFTTLPALSKFIGTVGLQRAATLNVSLADAKTGGPLGGAVELYLNVANDQTPPLPPDAMVDIGSGAVDGSESYSMSPGVYRLVASVPGYVTRYYQSVDAFADRDPSAGAPLILNAGTSSDVRVELSKIAIERIAPTSGSDGVAVSIDGAGFDSGTTVTFGGAVADVTSYGPNRIDVVTPFHTSGAVDVVVATRDGYSSTLAAAYSYCTRPSVTPESTDVVVDAGQSAHLAVAATGAGSMHFQWYQGVSGDRSDPIGTDSNFINTGSVSSDTSYWVLVSDTCGETESPTILVELSRPCEPATLSWTTKAMSVMTGTRVSLHVDLGGRTTDILRWYEVDGDTMHLVQSGGDTFETPALQETTSYRVTSADSCSTLDSGLLTIRVINRGRGVRRP